MGVKFLAGASSVSYTLRWFADLSGEFHVSAYPKFIPHQSSRKEDRAQACWPQGKATPSRERNAEAQAQPSSQAKRLAPQLGVCRRTTKQNLRCDAGFFNSCLDSFCWLEQEPTLYEE